MTPTPFARSLHFPRDDSLPALVHLHVLNNDVLLAAGADAVQGEHALLIGRQQARGSPSEACGPRLAPSSFAITLSWNMVLRWPRRRMAPTCVAAS